MRRQLAMAPALAVVLLLLAACTDATGASRDLSAPAYADKVRGAWQATMIANFSGLDLQGIWLDEPGPPDGFEWLSPDEWSTDDDTHVEYVDLHILEEYGVAPSYADIRDEWVDHLNNDIWVSTRAARDLMDDGVVPPATGSAELNPSGVWSIDAQLQTELFGLIAPGLPGQARQRASFFARVTNSGLAVEVSAFYAHLYAEAFLEDDIGWLIDRALAAEPDGSPVATIVADVRTWHADHPDDWRTTRRLIRDRYDVDPDWWGSQVNFAVTVMALLYGEGDFIDTVEIAALAGWDADNNMTTVAGLLGVIIGFDDLPDVVTESTDVYFNQDLTGDFPIRDTVTSIVDRTIRLGEQVMFVAGARFNEEVYELPLTDTALVGSSLGDGSVDDGDS